MSDDKPQRIFKPTPKTKYFSMRNVDVQRPDLSYEAIGLLVYLISLPDDWELRVETLYRDGFAGRDKVRRMLNELKEKQYIRLVRLQDKDGKFTDTFYEVYGIPEDNPEYNPENRTPENPSDGKTVRRQNRKTAKPLLQSKQGFVEKKNKEKTNETAHALSVSFSKILSRLQANAIITTSTHLELFKSDFEDYPHNDLWEESITILIKERDERAIDPDKSNIDKPYGYLIGIVKNRFASGLIYKESEEDVKPINTLFERKIPNNIN